VSEHLPPPEVHEQDPENDPAVYFVIHDDGRHADVLADHEVQVMDSLRQREERA